MKKNSATTAKSTKYGVESTVSTVNELSDLLNGEEYAQAYGFDNREIKAEGTSDSQISNNLLFNNKRSEVFTLSSEEISKLEPHPFMDAVPQLNEEQKYSLKYDVQANGFLEAVIITRDMKIVDGRARVEISQDQEIEHTLLFTFYEGEENLLLDRIMSKNIFRRNMNQGQKAAGALTLLEIVKKENSEKLSKKMSLIKKNEFDSSADDQDKINSRTTVAKYFNVSSAYIGKAKLVYEASGELFKKVLNGETSLEEAYNSFSQKANNETKSLDEFLDVYVAEYGQLDDLYISAINFIIDLGMEEIAAARLITKNLKAETSKKEKWEKLSPDSQFNTFIKKFLDVIKIHLKNDSKAIKEFEKKIDLKLIKGESEKLKTVEERLISLRSKLNTEEQLVLDNTVKLIITENTEIPEDKTMLFRIKKFAKNVLEMEHE